MSDRGFTPRPPIQNRPGATEPPKPPAITNQQGAIAHGDDERRRARAAQAEAAARAAQAPSGAEIRLGENPDPRPAPPQAPAYGACGECVYWVGPLDPQPDSHGECRVRPPLLGLPLDIRAPNVLEAIWPWTRGTGWCGEFLRR